MAPAEDRNEHTEARHERGWTARDRARAAQERKARALEDLPEDARADELAEPADIGEEHTPSGTDPANAPTRRDRDRSREDTEKPTRA